MNLTLAKKQLAELERRYQEWVAPINQAIRECSYKVNRDGYTRADYERDVGQIREQQRAKYDPYQEIYEFLDQLCPAYLEATDEQRAAIRATASDKNSVMSAMLGYIYHAAKQIQSPADREWLRWGLAAASIENCHWDYRDVLLALAELYVAAERAGLDPRPDFKAVSRLSGRETPRGGTTSVRGMLANFHRYAVLKERRAKQDL
jgi:hypothetical protein